jgi:DNA-directed RNA polymerase subunit RPC12/RpoP
MNDNTNIPSDMAVLSQRCITCHKELPIDEIGKRRYRSSKPDALWIYTRYGECRECASKRKARERSLHPNYMKEWYLIIITKLHGNCGRTQRTNRFSRTRRRP